MVGEDEGVVSSRVGSDRPLGKIHQGLPIGHIHFAKVGHHLRVQFLKIVVLGDPQATCAGPVTIAAKRALVAINLSDNRDLVR